MTVDRAHLSMLIVTMLSVMPQPGQASLPDLISLGPRSSAMAGTGVAVADDWEATYQNPAGLSQAQTKLSLGMVYGGYRLQIDGEPHPLANPAGVQIGASVKLPLGGILTDRIGIGLGLYLPAGVVNRVSVPFPEVPRRAPRRSHRGRLGLGRPWHPPALGFPRRWRRAGVGGSRR